MFVIAHAVPSTMAFFRSAQCILGVMGMSMTSAAMTMPMLMKEEKSKNVGEETKTSNYENKLGIRDGLWFDKSLYGL